MFPSETLELRIQLQGGLWDGADFIVGAGESVEKSSSSPSLSLPSLPGDCPCRRHLDAWSPEDIRESLWMREFQAGWTEKGFDECFYPEG